MPYKFEQLEVWQLSLEYIDLIYTLADKLPRNEEYNLKSQIIRAATSISLNIAEGSTGQSDPEQARFLGMAVRSLIETVACHHIIKRRGYIQDEDLLRRSITSRRLLRENCSLFVNPFLHKSIKQVKNQPRIFPMICYCLKSSIVYRPSSIVHGPSNEQNYHRKPLPPILRRR